MTHENVRVLPFQVRPRSGEGIRSFIVRLAHVNHLPPRYLRTYLCEPPEHLGLPSWTRLAAATGRAPETLLATLETRRCLECDAEIPPSDVIGRQALRCSQACREKAYRKRHPRAPVQKAPCRECGKSMKIQPGQRYRLCSSACRRANYLKHEEKWLAEADPADPSGPRICPVCDGPMFSAARRTCSDRCRQRARRQQLRQPPANPPSPPPVSSPTPQPAPPPQPPEPAPTASTRPCETCGEPLPAGPCQQQRRTCSQRCRQKAYRQRKAQLAPPRLAR